MAIFTVTVAIAVLVGTLSTLGILLFHYASSRSIKRRVQGRSPPPPGSLGLPWLGETFDFVKHFQKNELVSFCEKRVAKYGQTFKTCVLGTPVVVLEPPAGNKFVFANEGKLLENAWPASTATLLGPDSMTNKPSELYKTARRHAASFLTPVAVAQYLPMVEQITKDHLASCWQPPKGRAQGDDFQLLAYDLMKNLTFRMMASLCLSLGPGPDFDELLQIFSVWAKGLMQPAIKIPGFPYHSAVKARGGIMDLLEKLMARRRTELGEGRATETQDVLSFLMTQPDENGKKNTDAEVKDNLLMFLFAGHDTSSSVLTMTIMYLAKNPSIYQRVREEHDAIANSKAQEDGYPLTQEDVRAMKYTWAVLQEILRLKPPVAGAFREVVQDFEYNGYTILKGWKLYWTNQVTHENPKFFNNPQEFDPSRFEAGGREIAPFTYLPFGGGVRLCPGNEFAKLEMLVIVHYLTRNYMWTLCKPDEPVVRKQFPKHSSGTPIKVRKHNKSFNQ